MVSVERVLEYGKLETESLYSTAQHLKVPNEWPSSGKLDFQSITLRYHPDDPCVLKGINCEVKGSEKVKLTIQVLICY